MENLVWLYVHFVFITHIKKKKSNYRFFKICIQSKTLSSIALLKVVRYNLNYISISKTSLRINLQGIQFSSRSGEQNYYCNFFFLKKELNGIIYLLIIKIQWNWKHWLGHHSIILRVILVPKLQQNFVFHLKNIVIIVLPVNTQTLNE